MSIRDSQQGLIGRRSFLAGVAAAGALAALGQRGLAFAADAAPASPGAKPNSVINGVKIGCNTYSYRGAHIDTAEQTLKALVDSGLSECELKDGPINAYLGYKAPKKGEESKPGDNDFTKMLAKAADLKKLYNDAGVNIHIHKRPFGKSDEEIEFNFQLAKVLGCVAITTERDEKLAAKLAPFAEKHKIYVAFHNHTKNVPVIDKQDPIFDIGKYIALNLDIGHYFGGTKGKSPIPVIEKYHDRIISLHLKDKTAEDRNLSWGKGGTPIKETLQLLKKEKWPIYADVELEYPIPKDSDPVKEMQICLKYCRDALA